MNLHEEALTNAQDEHFLSPVQQNHSYELLMGLLPFFVSFCVAGVRISQKVGSSAREIDTILGVLSTFFVVLLFLFHCFLSYMKVDLRSSTLCSTGPSEKCQAGFVAGTLFLLSCI